MAMTLTASEIRPPSWWPSRQVAPVKRRLRGVICVAIAAGIVIGLYTIAVVPALQRRSKVKSIAAQIDGLVPNSEPLYAVAPDYQPFLFYIRSRLVYVSRIDDLPLAARYLLIQPEKEQLIMESDRWAPLHARPILTVTDYRKRTVILSKVSDGNQ